MSKIRSRLVFDLIMTALLVFEMFFELTGDTLHEVIGIIFFVTIIAHMALSYKWAKGATRAMKKGKLTGKGRAHLVMGILLLVVMIPMVASSIVISQLLPTVGLDASGLNTGHFWTLLHTASAYALCIVTTVHLAMHWRVAVSAFKIPYNPERRVAINAGVTAAVALGAIALGYTGLSSVSETLARFDSTASGTGTNSTTDDSRSVEQVDSSSPTTSGSSGTSTSGASSSSSSSSSGSSSGSSSTSSSTSSSSRSTSTTVSGNCPLCSRHCPLSSPRCNRPYEAGLIT